MEGKIPPNHTPRALLLEAFDKLIKILPKKYTDLKSLLQQSIEQIKTETSDQMDANPYFTIFKLVNQTKLPKMIETSLTYLQKLLVYGYLDGDGKDDTANIALENDMVAYKAETVGLQTSRKLIDAIIEVICLVPYEKEDAIQLLVIKNLLAIVTSPNLEPHGQSLLLMFNTLYQINNISKTSMNQNSARTTLTQLVSSVLQAMEDSTLGGRMSKGRLDLHQSSPTNLSEGSFDAGKRIPRVSVIGLKADSPTISGELSSPTELSRESVGTPKRSMEGSTPTAHRDSVFIRKNFTSEFGIPHPNDRRATIIQKNNDYAQNEDSLNPVFIQDYIHKSLTSMIDDVCLYNEKVEMVKKQSGDPEMIKVETENIPLRVVPLDLAEVNDPKYSKITEVNIQNEIGKPAGLFGWCFMCRNTANVYCKDTKVPICSVYCKMKHLDDLDAIKAIQGTDPQAVSKRITQTLQDAIDIFKHLCVLATQTDNSSAQLRGRQLVFELLRNLLDNPGPTFLCRKEFSDIVKEHLCDAILKHSVSPDRPIVTLSLGIFVCLFNHFREHLKQEIAIFIDNIFLKMLESGNSSYYHRLLALQVIYKISQNARGILEFYLNYDCDVTYTNIVEKIVEFLCKIAQGKYSKSEFSTLIQPGQEYTLKTLALDSMISICRSLVKFADEFDNQERKLQQMKNNLLKESESSTLHTEEDEATIAMSEDAMRESEIDLDMIEKSKALKTEISKAIAKFNFKPKLGLKYLFNLRFIKEEPKEIAQFLMTYNANISKVVLGEYFGEEHKMNIDVLDAFTELVPMENLEIDDAMRHYLTFFDLPGEGQKVDRIMQIFARKYINDNPNSPYKSATAAYTLSYLMMMLQTSAHNPQVQEKDRMTMQQFCNLAKGINDGENLSQELLQGLYTRIWKVPLAIPDSERLKQNLLESSQASLTKRQAMFILESEKMVQKSLEKLKGQRDSRFIRVQSKESIKALVGVIWSPLLAVFGVLSEQSDDAKIFQMCLEGYQLASNLCGRFQMEIEKDTFINSLYNITGFKRNFITREIKEKNLRAVHTLLEIGATQGNMLRSSWRVVLECISRIDYYLHFDINQRRDSLKSESTALKLSSETKQTDSQISELVKAAVDSTAVDLIFSKSNLFGADEIVEFITFLCQISTEEFKEPKPRMFCLQKLVEVTEYNMDRVKFVWMKIWNVMKTHLGNVGCHNNLHISMFAIDSLRQMAMKFLKKEEFASFDFQREFLKPFEIIFPKVPNEHLEIKELILNCIDSIVTHSSKSLHSGWKTIFDVLQYSASSKSKTLIDIAFKTVQKYYSEDLSEIRMFMEAHLDLLLTFIVFGSDDISLLSLDYLQSSIEWIVKTYTPQQQTSQQIFGRKESKETEDETDVPNERSPVRKDTLFYFGVSEHGWAQVLGKLAQIATSNNVILNRKCLQVLLESLLRNGDKFDLEFWQLVIRAAIKPMFEALQVVTSTLVKLEHVPKDTKQELRKEAFSGVSKLFNVHHGKLAHLNQQMLELFSGAIENSSNHFVEGLWDYIGSSHEYYHPTEWNYLVATFEKLLLKTLPERFIYEETKKAVIEEKEQTKEFQDAIVQCLVKSETHLLVIGKTRDFLEKYYQFLEDDDKARLIESLSKSHALSVQFNENLELRYFLWKKVFNNILSEPISLYLQEREAFSTMLVLTFQEYNEHPDTEKRDNFLIQFLELGIAALSEFSKKCEEYDAFTKNSKLDSIKSNHVNGLMNQESGNQLTKEAESPEKSETEQITVDESFKLQELEKAILNFKALFYKSLVPQLELLHPSKIYPKLKELTQHLVILNKMEFFNPQSEKAGSPNRLNFCKEEDKRSVSGLITKYFSYLFEEIERK